MRRQGWAAGAGARGVARVGGEAEGWEAGGRRVREAPGVGGVARERGGAEWGWVAVGWEVVRGRGGQGWVAGGWEGEDQTRGGLGWVAEDQTRVGLEREAQGLGVEDQALVGRGWGAAAWAAAGWAWADSD